MDIFLSYSHEGPVHAERVRTLAVRLRDDGFSLRFDQFEQDHGLDWPLWCERGLRDARWILPVCTQSWLRRYFEEEPPGVGRGAAWEARVIRNLLWTEPAPHHRVLPLLLDDAPLAWIPPALAGQYWRIDGQYDALVERMWREGTPPWRSAGPADLADLNAALVGALPDVVTERAFRDGLMARGLPAPPAEAPAEGRWLPLLRGLARQSALAAALDVAWRVSPIRETLARFRAPPTPQGGP